MGASGLYNAISTGFMDSAFDDMPTNGGTEEKKRVYGSCTVRIEGRPTDRPPIDMTGGGRSVGLNVCLPVGLLVP